MSRGCRWGHCPLWLSSLSAKHCHSSWYFVLLSTRCMTTLAAAALRPSQGMRAGCPLPGRAPSARETTPARRSPHPLRPFPTAARGPPRGSRPRDSTQSET
eukprot:6402551-Pyramimonas_sp.AAC.1